MTLKKFSDATKTLNSRGAPWLVYMHKRNPEQGRIDRATACVLAETIKSVARKVPTVNDPIQARSVSFGSAKATKVTTVDAIRAAAGRVTWRDAWRPRLRKVLGVGVFDTVLLARALRCVPYTGRCTLEVGQMTAPGGIKSQVLRVVGRDWRVIVAGRVEPDATEFKLGERTR